MRTFAHIYATVCAAIMLAVCVHVAVAPTHMHAHMTDAAYTATTADADRWADFRAAMIGR